MLTVAQYYARNRWGDQWGITRIIGGKKTNPHRGHDIKTGGRADTPALYPGRVTARGSSSVLGYYVVVKTAHGYDYYCHLLNGGRPAVGTNITRGTKIGTTATWGDYTGSAWSGPHLHYGSGPNPRSIFEGATHNATTLITSALTAIQGGGTSPVQTPIHEEDDMLKPVIIERDEGSPEISLVAPWLAKPGDAKQQGYIVFTDPDEIIAVQQLYGRGGGVRGYGGSMNMPRSRYVKAQEIARLVRQRWLESGGDSSGTVTPLDLTPVLSAIAGIPSAEQNGAAARDAIVKPS